MGTDRHNLKNTVAAVIAVVMFSIPCHAQQALGDGGQGASPLDTMYAQLQSAPKAEAVRIGNEIRHALSKSGSPAMNLLLKRGRAALERGDTRRAIQHLTALTDHAPGFAEGFHARSVAYARVGKMGPAMADLERALSLEPRNFAAIYSLGALLEQVEQPDLARRAYLQLRDIHPHFEDVDEALARLDAQVGGSDI